MVFKNNGITDVDSWKVKKPPMRGEKQWKCGRSAMELARYMTESYPNVPDEIQQVLIRFTDSKAEFDWEAEYVTSFSSYGLGSGEGRNHDAFMYNNDVVIGIEGKADEPLGSQLIGKALETASDNKMLRINGMIDMLFGDKPENHKSIRYQLVTACTATLLEARSRNVTNAVVLVIVLKRQGYYNEKNIIRNNADIERFLTETGAQLNNDLYLIPTPFGRANKIDLYFKKIEIAL